MTRNQRLTLRLACLVMVVLVVGLTWLYLPSFTFSVLTAIP